ncbi:hypothetical protein Tco_1485595 [Tanacetum coccineum]
MVVQNQSELGEGSAILTDPHHTPTIIQPSTQPQKTQKPRKPKERTLSLKVEQDSGNITKTRSKATPNESNSLRTTLGGGPRRQETMRDTIAQTRFENVSKLSNDSLLAREKTKTSQNNEIASLKRRGKKLEKKNRLRNHKLKRLYKVGLTAMVESSGDEENLGEDASKQGRRINAIDADEDITLVSVPDDANKEMFDVDTLNGEEVFVAEQNENVVKEVVDAAQVTTAATIVTITTKEITLAQALADLKSTKPKAKGITFREPGESTTTIFSQQLQDKGLSQDKGKEILVEPDKPLKKKDQLKLDEEIALKLQVEIDEEERIAKAEEEKIDEANIAWDDIQAKVDVDYQLAERLQAEEQEKFTIKEKATLFKELLEQRRKHFAAKRAEEKRNKPPTKTQQKKIMITYLKNMEGWKHKDLKSKDFDSIKELFDKAFTRVNMFVDFRTELVEGSSKRAGTELEQEITKKQKVDDVQETTEVDDDQEAAKIKELMEIVPDEEEIAIDAIPLAVKSLRIVDWEDLEDLYKLVKVRYGSTRPVEDLDLVLWNYLKNMFEPHVEDGVWKNQQGYKVLEWKLYDSYGVHFLRMQSMHIYMLVEKKYPLTPPILSQMLEKKLQIDYESEMAYKNIKFRGGLLGLKVFLMLFGVTAVLIDDNAVQLKLVLLENFNENYSKCLRLLVKLQLPIQSYYC